MAIYLEACDPHIAISGKECTTDASSPVGNAKQVRNSVTNSKDFADYERIRLTGQEQQ